MNGRGDHDDRRDLGKLPCALLGLLLPRARRDEFIGDLLEEARQRAARGGAAQARRWLWGQVFHSCPSLVVARLRRLPMEHAVAVPAAAGVPGAFGGFRLGGQGRGRRSLAVTVSVAIHALILLAASVRGMWGVDELAGPKVMITFWNALPLVAPVFDEPGGGRRREPVRPEPRTQRVVFRPHQQNAIVPAPLTAAPSTGDSEPGRGSDHGDDSVKPGECPPGASNCGDESQILHVLPPQVGEKSCLSCPLPHLPPALMRIGTTQTVLTRICVDAAGRVTSAKIISGVGGSADDGVIETLAQWRFSPYAIGGRPVPFCYVSRFVFTAQ